MVTFRKIELENGMTALLHQDGSTPLAAVNLLFRAGSKYDPLTKSGLAHLFEHLMFSGTPLVPEFDTPIQEAGGENNAYTNSDYANYYSYGPAQNLETLLWLEADRMHNLNVTQGALEVQQQVVIEELHETCLNVPYGDIWHHVLPLIYRDHPYQWPVIGRDEKEIGDISLEDVLRFHKHYYMAGNAILSVAGNIDLDKTEQLIHQCFGGLPGGKQEVETYLFDLDAYQPTRLQLKSTVPVEAFYMIFPMPERNSAAFYALDLFSDLLVDGRSSILYQSMIKETQLLSTVDAYITGTLDSGLFIIEGRLSAGADIIKVEQQIWQILEQLITSEVTTSTMEKLKNNVEAAIIFAEAGTLNKAMNLAFFELIGDAALINDEAKLYQQISEGEMRVVARAFLAPELVSLFHYVPDA